VLCNAFGHEEMAVHRGYLHLARRLARAGYAVLRFDYEGTGDSSGDPHADHRAAAWLASIDAARARLLELSGAPRVVLFGTRLGATLALSNASQTPVDGLILFGPPASGRSWVREMRALHAAREQALPVAPPEPEEAVAGFPLSEAVRSELSALDWRASGARPARAALVIARDDLRGPEEKLVAELRERGVEVTSSSVGGFAAFAQDDPLKSVAPELVFDEIVRWLGEHTEPLSAPASVGPVSVRGPMSDASAAFGDVREEAFHVDELFGILTEPVAPDARARTVVLLLNIGANHHVGSNAMYVTMARVLASRGFRVARLDFSGLGDSARAVGGRENDIYAPRFFAEVRAVLDFLFARGVERAVLGGLCSGAYAAYHTATADPRVAGLIMINPLTFHWNEGDSVEVRSRQGFKSSHFYKQALWQPKTWARIARGQTNLKGIANELAKRAKRRAQRESRAILARLSGATAETTDVERGFRALCTRGAKCLLLFGAHDGGVDLIEEHLGAGAWRMRQVPGFRMEIIEGPDHTFTPLWTRRLLFRRIEEYMLEHFGGEA
jgi:pimeloyl-ACP methyl ester carboxylesterase